MSQSPAEFAELPPDHPYLRGIEALNLMLNEGGTLSGHERNCCFLNTGGGRFADVSAVTGLDFDDDGRAVALVDWDHDGDVDLWSVNRTAPIVRFLRNDMAAGNNFLSLRLVGRTCNRDAVGARVEVVTAAAEGKRHLRTVTAGHGYLTQSSRWLHFGLGGAEQIERLTVRWPGGELEQIDPPAPGGRFLIVQGSGKAAEVEKRAQRAAELAASEQQPLPSSDAARIVVVQRARLPQAARWMTYDGRFRPLRSDAGEETLIVLWAPWCPNCRTELRELAEREEELSAAGVRVVAIEAAGVESEPLSADGDGQQFLNKIGFPYESGKATPELLTMLEEADAAILGRPRPLPLPTSFLLGRGGRIAVIYKGPLRAEDVLADVGLRERSPEQLRDAAAPLAGSWAMPATWQGQPVDPWFQRLTSAVFSQPRNYVLMAAIPLLIGVAIAFRRRKHRRGSKAA